MAGIDRYTKLMLHMNDSSFKSRDGRIPVNVGNVSLDTSVKKFGNGSAKFTSIMNQYLEFPYSQDWHFGNEDFTIDFWFRAVTLNGKWVTFYEQRNSTTEYCPVLITLNNLNELLVFLSFNNTSWATGTFAINGGVINQGLWYHVALVRDGEEFKLYLNGTQVGNTYTNSQAFIDKASAIRIGCSKLGIEDVVNVSLDGNIDEFRISKGIARWTTNFTPPNKVYYMQSSLIKEKYNKIHTLLDDTLIYPNVSNLTQEHFEKWGMDTLEGYENEISKVTYEMEECGGLDDGRVVRKKINKNKWRINRLEVGTEPLDSPTKIFHLIKSNNNFYFLNELDEWERIELIEPLTKEDFEQYGMSSLDKVTSDKLQELEGVEFEVITWTDEEGEKISIQLQGQEIEWSDEGKLFEIVIDDSKKIKNIMEITIVK